MQNNRLVGAQHGAPGDLGGQGIANLPCITSKNLSFTWNFKAVRTDRRKFHTDNWSDVDIGV
jgi:hypothetical protein